MNRQPLPDPEPPSPPSPLALQLVELRSRLDRARAVPGGHVHDQLVSDLGDAHEELQVADVEIRAQQAELAQLLGGPSLARWQQDRLRAAAPVATLTTDVHGIIRSVNAAASVLLVSPAALLVGRPVIVLFPVDVRRTLRTAMSDLARHARPFEWTGTLQLPDRSTVDVGVTATPRAGGDGATTWMLLDTTTSATTDLVLTTQLSDVLTRLTTLATSTTTLQQVVDGAAALCHEALGDDVDLTVTVGPLDAPGARAATHPAADALDRAQLAHPDGPHDTAHRTASTVLSTRLHDDPRWPDLVPAVPARYAGVISVPLLAAGTPTLGVLTVYGHPGADLRRTSAAAEVLAATVAAVIDERARTADLQHLTGSLQRALSDRAVVDQARGMIMSQTGCTSDEALDHLVELGESTGRDLRTVALGVLSPHHAGDQDT